MCAAAGAQTLYTVTDSQVAPLLAIDPASAAVRTVVPSTGATQAVFPPSAIDVVGRRLFFLGAPGAGSSTLPGIFAVDLNTGAVTSRYIQPTGGPISFFVYDPASRKLTTAVNLLGAPLIAIDPVTGEVTALLESTGSVGAFFGTLDSSGRRLFFLGAIGRFGSVPKLFTVDLSSLVVSSQPIRLDSPAFFVYDPQTGTILSALNSPGVPIVSIDPASASVTTLVSSTGAGSADFGALDPVARKLYFEGTGGSSLILETVDLNARTASARSIARIDTYRFLQFDPLGDVSSCGTDPYTLCLNRGRFSVRVAWKTPEIVPTAGMGLFLTADTGAFWFFTANNLEVVVKVVDGRAFNNRFWVFAGALTDLEHTITVTDTATGATRSYANPPGHVASFADLDAF